MFEKRVLNIYSVIIGIFFLVSGIGKVMDTSAFSELINQYGLGHFMLLSPVIAVAEILLGLILVFLINPKIHAGISFIALVIFTAAFAYAHFTKGVNDCGCLGTIQHADLSPVFSFARNFILLVMTGIVFVKYPKKEEADITGKWKIKLIVVIVCVSIFFAGLTFNSPTAFNDGFQQHKYQNQHIRNTALARFIKTSPDSTYLVFCFSYTCPHCWNSIENLRQYDKNKTVDRMVAFSTLADSSKIYFMNNFQPDFAIRDLPIDTMIKFVDKFPTAFYIKNDTIKVIIESELPSSVTFKKEFLEHNAH